MKRSRSNWSVGEALNNVRDVIRQSLTPEERETFEQLVAATIVDRTAPYTLATDDGIRLVAQLLSYVRVPVPESVRTESNAVGQVERVVPTTTDVFIIHGHDLTNTLRLRTLLRERLNLNPIVLNERPGKGREFPMLAA